MSKTDGIVLDTQTRLLKCVIPEWKVASTRVEESMTIYSLVPHRILREAVNRGFDYYTVLEVDDEFLQEVKDLGASVSYTNDYINIECIRFESFHSYLNTSIFQIFGSFYTFCELTQLFCNASLDLGEDYKF